MSIDLAKSVSVEMAADELVAALTAVLPHAAAVTDRSASPAIQAVRFEVESGRLLLVATDRYTLGVSRPDTRRVAAQFEALLSTSDALALLRAVKPSKALPVELSVSGRTFRAVTAGASVTFGLVDASFPAWRRILEPAGEQSMDADACIRSFNPAQLARFGKATRGKFEVVNVFPGMQNKPTLVTVGDHFAGVIMTVRNPMVAVPMWVSPAAAVASERAS